MHGVEPQLEPFGLAGVVTLQSIAELDFLLFSGCQF